MEPSIRRLSENLIRKIAAGEVIERPASVVKELVENSVDAGAGRIWVETGQAGRQLLRVTDDGRGMTRADAALCAERHATSKMSLPSDLFAISTLGFRGEALASICAVARVCIETRSEAEEEGSRVVIEGGVRRALAGCGRAPGTTVDVRDLFFNTPARRKFLRQRQNELRHLSHAVIRLAAASPEIGFRLVHDGRTALDLLPGSPRARAAEVLGADPSELLELGVEEDGIRVAGYLVPVHRQTGGGRGNQHLMVRGRPVAARGVTQAVVAGYGGLLAEGVQPSYVLWLDLDAARIDVNVHPAKREIRFADEVAVTEVVERAVRLIVRGGGSSSAPALVRALAGAGGRAPQQRGVGGA